MAITLRTYQSWIAKSAKQLDKDVPGWYKRIDLHRLNMHDDKVCICGQLRIATQPNPDYKVSDSYLEKLGIQRSCFDELAFSATRGFHMTLSMKIKGVDKPYDLQLRLWKHQIAKRLKGKTK